MRRGEPECSAPSSRKAGNGRAAGQPQRGSEQEGADRCDQQAAPGVAGRLEPQHSQAGDCDDRDEQRRTDAEQEQQRIAEIGAGASEPVRRRPAGGGAQRWIGRIVGRQRDRGRKAQQDQHRAPGADREPAHCSRPAPRASQVPDRASARARQQSPCPTPKRSSGVRILHAESRVKRSRGVIATNGLVALAMDRSDVIIFGGGLVGLALASALDSSGLSAIVVDPADPDAAQWRGVRRADERRVFQLDAHAEDDRRCRPSRRAGLPDPADRGRRRAGARRATFRSRR